MFSFLTERDKGSNPKLLRRIVIKKGDITKQRRVDAIVSTIPIDMDVGGSLNQSLIKAAGPALDDFLLANIYKPRPGDTYVVPGFELPVPHIIYVVTPLWRDAFDREDAHLLRCYRMPMKTASSMLMKRIAFPAIGTGRNAYPLERAARMAIRGIAERLTPGFEEVSIVCKDDKTYQVFKDKLNRYAAGH